MVHFTMSAPGVENPVALHRYVALKFNPAISIPMMIQAGETEIVHGATPNSVTTSEINRKRDVNHHLKHMTYTRYGYKTSIPRHVPDYEITAVLFQKGINMGSADAVADLMRQRCVPNVIISSILLDFLGKPVESSSRMTIGWQAYLDYTSFFFKFIPDGVFTLKPSQCFFEDDSYSALSALVVSRYEFKGTLLTSSTTQVTTVEETTPAGDTIKIESDRKRNKVQDDIEQLEPRENVSPELEKMASLDTSQVFIDDGLPDLSNDQEQLLFQSEEWGEINGIEVVQMEIPMLETSSAVQDLDEASVSSHPSISSLSHSSLGDSSSSSPHLSVVKDDSLRVDGLKNINAWKPVVLKPRRHPTAAHSDVLSNVYTEDPDADVQSRFQLEKPFTEMSLEPDKPALSSAAIVHTVGSFYIHLNHQRQIEKLEFIYQNYDSTSNNNA